MGEGRSTAPTCHDPGKPPKDAKGWPHFACGVLGLRALAGSVAVRDRVTEACDAILALLVVRLALRGFGRGGHVARLG